MAKTVQELILEAEMQALLHEADVKAAAGLQRLHRSAVLGSLSQHCWTVGPNECGIIIIVIIGCSHFGSSHFGSRAVSVQTQQLKQ